MRRKIAVVLLIVLVCLGVVVTRAVWEGRSALGRGDSARDAGDVAEAIRHWRRAARWYVPGAPHVASAYERLETLARAAQERGDAGTALAAWRGVRGSILATRSVYTPFSDRLEPANRNISRLMARLEGGKEDASPAARAKWHYDLLSRDEAPSVPWTLVALAGLALWLGGGVLFAARGVTADDRLVGRTAALAGLLVAGGLVVWVLGLYQA